MTSKNSLLRFEPELAIQGIPWAYENPTSHIVQWKAKLGFFVNEIRAQIKTLEAELRKVNLLPETRSRLESMVQSHERQLASVTDLLPEFRSDDEALSVLKAVQDRVPSNQHFSSYFTNIFRDWVWGETEIRQGVEALEDVLQDSLKGKTVLVVGAGACRLPLELHLRHEPELTVALDINPLLLITAKKLLAGETFELVEFTNSQLGGAHAGRVHKLQTEIRQPKSFEFLFADGLNLPFKAKSFDAIITPWFLDIVPMDTLELAERFNHVLKPGGCWVNSGPLGFARPFSSTAYSPAELPTVVENAGFQWARASQSETPYLASPHSAQRRSETVYSFCAVKNKDAKQRPRYSFLPEFLVDSQQPLPLSDELKQTILDLRLNSDLLSLVDGQRSIAEMARLISQHSNASAEKTLEYLLTYYVALFEKGKL